MEGSEYNFLSRLFHRLTLGSKTISEISFDIEKNVFSRKDINQITDGKHLFVSGLARSGTTALMRCLYETKRFASLTYADMPFVLAPNLWRKLSFSQAKSENKERAHKDGVFISSSSPEALDEVFWKVFLNDNYICKDRLLINKPSSEVLALFDNYIDLILVKNDQGDKQRYLSKNNNNILRLSSILKHFPHSNVIIPYRDPLQHALSLKHQHQHFCKIQNESSFTLNYMNWIGHHEFGLSQKPFLLNQTIFNQMLRFNKEHINFWLLSWLNYYSYVLEHYSESCILFSYENFCRDPNTVMKYLFEKIDIQTNKFNFTHFSPQSRKSSEADPMILEECMEIYKKLNIIPFP